jgi:hypothetical protein
VPSSGKRQFASGDLRRSRASNSARTRRPSHGELPLSIQVGGSVVAVLVDAAIVALAVIIVAAKVSGHFLRAVERASIWGVCDRFLVTVDEGVSAALVERRGIRGCPLP